MENSCMSSADRLDAIEDLLRGRHSVRGFLPRPLAPDVLRKVFGLAQLAPSNCNIQPWIVHVLSGASAERMRATLGQAASEKSPPSPDLPMSKDFKGIYRDRQISTAKTVFGVQGIAREDVEARNRSYVRNFRFFDAPHVAFLFMHGDFGAREAADCGMFAQTLMLAMAAYGIGSCAQGALGIHASVVRRELDIPNDIRLLFGIAFGYEDPGNPVNAARLDRASLAEAVTFHD